MLPLRSLMIRKMQLHRLARRTQEAYLRWVTDLARFHNRSPDQLTPKLVEDYLLSLSNERGLSCSSINQALNGLMFFYLKTLEKPSFDLSFIPRKRPKRLPQVLSHQELQRLFASVTNLKHYTMLLTTYAAGLRVSELVNLKVCDLHSDRGLIRVNQGKSSKDRYTLLSKHLLKQLRFYWEKYRPQDWLFPGNHKDHPLNISSIQSAYTQAKRRANITRQGGIHTLRHCFATHLLESGVDLLTIKTLLGHSDLSTTAVYLHLSRKHLTQASNLLDALFAHPLTSKDKPPEDKP